MVATLFESLLEETSQAMGVPMKSNANDTCVFSAPNGMKIQMEVDEEETQFLILAEIGQVPIGKYRENLFKDALIANANPPPRVGRFAYSEQSEMLLMFEHLSVKNLNGQKISDYLQPFIEKAHKWQQALLRGETPHIEAESTPAGTPDITGLFDILK